MLPNLQSLASHLPSQTEVSPPPTSTTEDFNSIRHDDIDLPITIRKEKRKCTTKHLNANYASYSHFSPAYKCFLSSLSSITVPKCVQEALSIPGWKVA